MPEKHLVPNRGAVRRLRPLYALLASLILGLSACGNSSADPSPEASPSGSTTSAVPTTAQNDAPEPFSLETAVLTAESLGPIRFPMTIEEAERVTGMDIVVQPPVGPYICAAEFAGNDQIVLYLTEPNTIGAVDVRGKSIETSAGISVGDTLEEAARAHPTAERSEWYSRPILVAHTAPAPDLNAQDRQLFLIAEFGEVISSMLAGEIAESYCS